MSRPLFDFTDDPDTPTKLAMLLHDERHGPFCADTHGGVGATCEWCMEPMTNRPMFNGFFCSADCCLQYMLNNKPAGNTHAA